MSKTTIEQLDQMAIDYMKRHWDNGGSSEFDKSINEISRAKINVLKEQWDKVYLYKVNAYSETDIHCFEFTGQKIYNFSCDFALQHENNELVALMNDPKGLAAFENIFKIAGDEGAVFFQWS